MQKTYRYRLYPTKKQQTILKEQIECCRWLYNYTLANCIHNYETDKIFTSYYDSVKLLPNLKKEKPELKTIYAQVLYNVMYRVDNAFKNFFRRCKQKKGKVGYPRFKGKNRYKSITYPQHGFHINNDKTIHVSKIGEIPFIYHRPIRGKIKSMTISRTTNNKWYVSFIVCIDDKITIKKPHNNQIVGIDVGITTLCTLSDGNKIENPHWLRRKEKELKRAKRKLKKFTKGSNEWKKQHKVITTINEKITNQRKNYIIKSVNDLTQKYGTIIFENLNIKKMLTNPYLKKHIKDASWNFLITSTINKAEEAGCIVVLVDPRNTSQMCSQCGQIVKKELSVRIHKCPHCGLVMDRDLNAAKNILRLGLQSLEHCS